MANDGSVNQTGVGKFAGQETGLATYIGPYVSTMLGQGAAAAAQPYTPYMGPLTAGTSSLQNQAFQGLANLTVPTGQMGAYQPRSFTGQAPQMPGAYQPQNQGMMPQPMPGAYQPNMANAGNPQMSGNSAAPEQIKGWLESPQPMPGAYQPQNQGMMPQTAGGPPKGWYQSLSPYSPTGQQAPIDPMETILGQQRAMTDPTSVPEGSYIGPLGRVYKDGEGPRAFVETQQPQILQSPQGQGIGANIATAQGMYSLGRDGRPQIDSSLPMKPPQTIQDITRENNPRIPPQTIQPRIPQGQTIQDITRENNQPQGQSIIEQYMNPYLQASLEPQIAEARRQADITRNANAGRLTRAGAFGGGRQAIMESEGQRNMLRNVADITGQGYNTAYDKAVQAFGDEEARFRTGQEDINKYGFDVLNDQSNAGSIQRGIESEGIAADIAQFESERDYPYQQTKYMSSLLQGLPLSSYSNPLVQPSTLSQMAGGSQDLISLLNDIYK